MAQCMLTTFDNPYNPFDDFTKWWLWDVTHGYNSVSYTHLTLPTICSV